MTRKYFIKRAIIEAQKSIMSSKHGSIAVVGGKIISRGFNNFLFHAEMSIFKKINYKKMRKVDVYVIRINGNGKLINSKPCSHCLNSLKKLNIKKIYYSDENGDIVCEKTNDMKTDYISSGYKIGKNKKF
jgi:tRNA(Arg) A34 adenosine deaminase TadA